MNQNILREYLVSLGFQVNRSEEKRVATSTLQMDRRVTKLGAAAVTAAASVVTLSTVFAKQMEKLWYSARYADTTAEKMQGLEFAARNVGLEGGRASGALKNMAGAIRSNPGLIGLLNSLGVKVQGRDKSDVMLDLVGALKQMPFYVAERYANLFGIDAETLFNMGEGLDQMRQAVKLRKQMADDMGVDTNKAAEAGKAYMKDWRELEERVGLFGQAVMIAVQGPVHEFMQASNELVKHWTEIAVRMDRVANGPGIPGSTKPPGMAESIWTGVTGRVEGDRVSLSPEVRARLGMPERDDPIALPEGNHPNSLGHMTNNLIRWFTTRKNKGPYVPQPDKIDPAAVEAVTAPDPKLLAPSAGLSSGEQLVPNDAQATLAALERKYGLPQGLLDRVWKRESGRGKNMLSPAGAKGHFGFMDPTAKEYGLKDPNDFNESADASARKWRDLLKQYGGDTELAAAAYNWGDGNMAKYGLGRMPKETQDYVKDVAGGLTVNQETNIHVHGVKDPKEAADAVAKEQRTVNGDVVRSWAPKVK